MRQRYLRIVFTALVLGFLAYSSTLLLCKAPVARASAYVIASDPVDGSTIASVPREIHIYFNGAISTISDARVFVVPGSGQTGTQKGSLVEMGTNPGIVSGSNSDELIIPLRTSSSLGQGQELPQGSYLIRWVAVANDDGRTTFGAIGFNVGVSSTGLAGTPLLGPSTSNDLAEIRALDTGHVTNILIVVWEWVTVAALTLWIGTLVMEQFVLSDGGRCTELRIHAKKQAKSLQWLCLSALLFSAIVSLVLRTTELVRNLHTNQSSLSMLQSLLVNTNYGRFWLVGLVLTLMAMGLLYWINRPGVGRVQGYTPTRKGMLLHLASVVGSAISALRGIREGSRFSLSPRSVLGYCQRVLRSAILRLTKSQGEAKPVNNMVQATRKAATTAPVRFRTGAMGTVPSTSPVSTEIPPSPAITIESRHPVAWLLLSGAILFTLVLSHAPVQTFHAHMSVILFAWLSLAALGVWFGCFVYLGYLILPLFNHKEPGYHTETLTAVLQRLMPFILSAIGIEIVSTLFLSEVAINQPQQLIGDPYGRTLLVQIVLLVVMLALSLYVLLWLHATLKHQVLLLPLVHADLPVRRLRQSELQQTKKSLGMISVAIIWLGGGVLLCIALMTFFTPPIHFPAVTYSNQSTESVGTTNVQTKQIGDLSVSLQILPGRSEEANTVILLIKDSKGELVTDAQVSLTTNMQVMDMGTKNVRITEGNPVYITTFEKGATFNMAGVWVIDVEIQRPEQRAVQGTFQVSFN